MEEKQLKHLTLHTNEKEVNRTPRRCEITIVKNGVKKKKMILVKDLPTNTKTGVWYTGGNAGHLIGARKEKKYKSNIWGTFLQWKDEGKVVSKGEQGYKIMRPVTKKTGDFDDNGNEEIVNVRKFYKVFNEEQTTPERELEKLQKVGK